MAAYRPAKEGVTAVAGSASSAARRQPTATSRGARVPQQSRAELDSGSRRTSRRGKKDGSSGTISSGGADTVVDPAIPAPAGPVSADRRATQPKTAKRGAAKRNAAGAKDGTREAAARGSKARDVARMARVLSPDSLTWKVT